MRKLIFVHVIDTENLQSNNESFDFYPERDYELNDCSEISMFIFEHRVTFTYSAVTTKLTDYTNVV